MVKEQILKRKTMTTNVKMETIRIEILAMMKRVKMKTILIIMIVMMKVVKM